ncbi:hypothetical protein Lalb_Chr09g0326101 [Lupinus albus]|uniref:Uncharacterized protein n=1 Tax=Lupinus albus TaxID=3870 RepID=A0A6A4Q071_LUPAL|nr:hypothetical protein Lalb_Chr09g0326101 [Lupinus albus]
MEENLLQRYWKLHQPSQSFFLGRRQSAERPCFIGAMFTCFISLTEI